jgi:AcrR family transcriptional regulator
MPKETFFNLPPEKRAAFLEIAIQAFAENDYSSVSVSALVQRAGIAKGSFYQYFDDKRDLYLHLIELASQEKKAFFNKHPPPNPGMGVFAYLRWMYTIGVQFEFSNPRMASLGYRALYGDAPLPEETLAVLREGSLQFFTRLVAQGQAQGDIRLEIDPAVAAFLFDVVFANLGDFIMQRTGIHPQNLVKDLAALESPEAQTIFNQVVDVLEGGLGHHSG